MGPSVPLSRLRCRMAGARGDYRSAYTTVRPRGRRASVSTTAPSRVPDDAPEFNGAWSNYPFFPSGMIVVNGAEQGLFVLRQK